MANNSTVWDVASGLGRTLLSGSSGGQSLDDVYKICKESSYEHRVDNPGGTWDLGGVHITFQHNPRAFSAPRVWCGGPATRDTVDDGSHHGFASVLQQSCSMAM